MNAAALKPILGEIVERKPHVYSSTFAAEVITCRAAGGRKRQVLCKRGGRKSDSYGHRGGVPYEAAVYERVLRQVRLPSPKCYGAVQDPATGEVCLLLEFIRGARVNQHGDCAQAMAQSARWIGQFHAAMEDCRPEFLTRYDLAYYLAWAQRTAGFTAGLTTQYPWLPLLCDRFAEIAGLLLGAPETILHGEYYPKNILIRRRVAYPVDWESAAIGPGEIDLASLIEGWDEKIRSRCIREYRRARWPKGAPSNFERVLTAAAMYLLFRWAGDRPEWTLGEDAEWRFQQLHSLGQQLGVIG